MDPFIGEIRIFGFNFAPEDWAYCNGQQLSVGQFQALFTLVAPAFGYTGNPPQTFNLPNLQSQAVMGAATMQDGGTGYLNQFSGAEKVLLTEAQLPTHNHSLGGETISTPASWSSSPGPTVLPNTLFVNSLLQKAFSNLPANSTLSPQAISAVGGNGTHENRQPFLTFNFCICTNGIYPDFP